MDHNLKPGDSNRITREYFDSLLLELRYLDSVVPSTELELYGQTFRTPVMTAALSHLDNQRPGGTVEMAKGALAAGAVMWTGMGGEAELESIVSTGVKAVKIVKPYADRSVAFRQIEHAEACGAFAVGMDIDHSFGGDGKFDVVLGIPMSSASVDDLKGFVRATSLPFIVKGVLSVTDALKCAEAGVRGIVVSHHHGIQSHAVPPLLVLPEIVKALGGAMPVYVDCGIETGVDAFKALALGATAVCSGRALMDAMGKEGADGVHKKINTMTGELAAVMARTCSRDIRSIDPSVIRRI